MERTADVVPASAKLTVSLRITGVRADGYHLLDGEMVTVDLADRLEFGLGRGVEVVDEMVGGLGLGGLDGGPANLVTRALHQCDREAFVRLIKRIPVGAGLGGGSADAAAVLRWVGCKDLSAAARLGADVPFCLVGGRARVTGIGDEVEPLPFEEHRYLLVLPPLAVDTAAAYGVWDTGARPEVSADNGGNDLEPAALALVPALASWRQAFAEVTGARPRLAGSGAAWFVEDDDGRLAARVGKRLEVTGQEAPVLSVRTVPAPS
jgi:4-diphosphocytidyl-2-C-methyl-D-erythritol kinase